MRNLFFLVVVLLALSCGTKSTLIDFDDLSTLSVTTPSNPAPQPVNPGDQFEPGSIITETLSGIRIVVLPFQWPIPTTTPPPSPQWTDDGYVTIETGTKAGGAINELHFNNTCLGVIDPGPKKITKATVKFADFGGNINLIENNTVHNKDDFTKISSPTGNGLFLTVNATHTGGALKGTLELSGKMGKFKFPGPPPPNIEDKDFDFKFVVGGGQELWIDDLRLHH